MLNFEKEDRSTEGSIDFIAISGSQSSDIVATCLRFYGKSRCLPRIKKYIAAILLLLELENPFSNSRNPDNEKDVHSRF